MISVISRYYCGAARNFKDKNGVHHDIQKMTCLWDRNWTAINVMDPCDWIQCLKPPIPPSFTNLRVTDWDGKPINFGDKITYVCEKGYQFEDDQNQVSISYQCQDGVRPETTRGFFNTPAADDQWPMCTKGDESHTVFSPAKTKLHFFLLKEYKHFKSCCITCTLYKHTLISLKEK